MLATQEDPRTQAEDPMDRPGESLGNMEALTSTGRGSAVCPLPQYSNQERVC